MEKDLLVKLAHAISSRELGVGEAAVEIGVTPATLRKHLSGEYVRSDSAAKYRRWLAYPSAAAPELKDRAPRRTARVTQRPSASSSQHANLWQALNHDWEEWHEPARIVDLFSGCGGLSLGFELTSGGGLFDSVLAVDIESSMLKVLDANRESAGKHPVGRRIDLSDIRCEAEALAFYLDHLTEIGAIGEEAARSIATLPAGTISELKRSLSLIDENARRSFEQVRGSVEYKSTVRRIPPDSFRQTSVLSFLNSLRFPHPTSSNFEPTILWWSDDTNADREGARLPSAPRDTIKRTRQKILSEWNAAIETLRLKAKGQGGGQLASSAHRINLFLDLIDNRCFTPLVDAWLDWRSERDALRAHFFAKALGTLRAAYAHEQVDVLLGGPPCQGFSRIGRGKLRSLRESGAQAHTDDDAGDERNRLLFSYVLMVAALRPKTFVFENVRHFKTEVRTSSGIFQADKVLAEAIQDLSDGGVTYGVSSTVLMASDHGIPQTRERFFMAGVRGDFAGGARPADLAAMILDLERHPEVPLVTALQGLPTPYSRMDDDSLVQVATPVPPPGTDPESTYIRWIRQEIAGVFPEFVDAHVSRAPRRDDKEWFAKMGPGERWMDYRVDSSPTLKDLTSLVSNVAASIVRNPELAQELGVDQVAVVALRDQIDGSLALRLLLESIRPEDGELAHHLLTPSYMGKREGRHGDWLARLAADKPCKTITSHMGKDTYRYIHPYSARTLSVREAARIQTFPDGYRFGMVGLVDAFRVIGNAVPPLLSSKIAERVGVVLANWEESPAVRAVG